MATEVLTDAFVEINGTDLSDHVRQLTLNYEAEQEDDTVMGDDTRASKPALKNWSLDVEFAQDWAASSVDATLFPLVGAAAFTVKIRKSTGSIAADNPEYTGNGVLESYPPLDNSVGELATSAITIQSAGTLSRNTS